MKNKNLKHAGISEREFRSILELFCADVESLKASLLASMISSARSPSASNGFHGALGLGVFVGAFRGDGLPRVGGGLFVERPGGHAFHLAHVAGAVFRSLARAGI